MKQLSIEQKAKRYDEAIEVARKIKNGEPINVPDGTLIPVAIFPELAESEDEKMRKGIIRNLEYLMDRAEGFVKDELKERIAWLEKQGEKLPVGFYYVNSEGKKFYSDTFKYGNVILHVEKQGEQNPTDVRTIGYWHVEDVEQKPTDKVEPKFNFKVSQWIVATGKCVYLIAKIDGFNVTLVDTNGDKYVFDASSLDDAHEWTIQDAKDGDVLVNWSNTAFIFKAIEDETVKFHIAYNEKWNAIKTPSTKLSHLGFPEPQFEFHPATKEQRDTLEKAMADAGYTFDFEKKELKKEE